MVLDTEGAFEPICVKVCEGMCAWVCEESVTFCSVCVRLCMHTQCCIVLYSGLTECLRAFSCTCMRNAVSHVGVCSGGMIALHDVLCLLFS